MDSTVKSAARVLEVLEYLADRRGPATVTEIAIALGYPQSSTSVLLKCLWNLGYLTQDPVTRAYRPTARVANLGQWVSVTSQHEALLSSLREKTGAVVSLLRPVDLHLEYVQTLGIDASGAGEVHPMMVLHAAGRALLSQGSDAEALVILRRSGAQLRERAITLDERTFLESLLDARRSGIVKALPRGRDTHATIAAPLPEGGMAIALRVPVERLTSATGAALLTTLKLEVARLAPLQNDLERVATVDA